MNEILAAQLADDFCCTPRDVMSRRNVFAVYTAREGRRRFHEQEECLLKIASVRGKLLVTGRADIVERCASRYGQADGAWFMEPATLRELDVLLAEFGACIGQAHPFFIPGRRIHVNLTGFDVHWYDEEAIQQFRESGKYGEAYAYLPDAPDVLGVSASRSGIILGMAGASRDSARMHQIGIDVEERARGQGIAVGLVSLLADALIARGVLPFYGTAMSHMVSQRVAVRAGFEPAWAELSAERNGEGKNGAAAQRSPSVMQETARTAAAPYGHGDS